MFICIDYFGSMDALFSEEWALRAYLARFGPDSNPGGPYHHAPTVYRVPRHVIAESTGNDIVGACHRGEFPIWGAQS